jgi:hypothetical protein
MRYFAGSVPPIRELHGIDCKASTSVNANHPHDTLENVKLVEIISLDLKLLLLVLLTTLDSALKSRELIRLPDEHLSFERQRDL